MSVWINRPVLNLGARGVLPEEIVSFPVLGWPDWSRNESTATIWTDVTQHCVNAVSTERALVGADARFS